MESEGFKLSSFKNGLAKSQVELDRHGVYGSLDRSFDHAEPLSKEVSVADSTLSSAILIDPFGR